MKKILILLLILAALSFFGYKTIRESVRNDLAQPVTLPSSTPTPDISKDMKETKESEVSRSLFVPYWGTGDSEIDEDYDEYLYFGVTPGSNGINRKEAGFTNLNKFIDSVPGKSEKKLVVRMLDSNITFPILNDTAKQKVLTKDSIAVAKKNGFSGIVLDLEVSAVPFDSLINQINQFTSQFYKESKDENLQFTIMFYGDTFYRLRPFDVKTLSKNADSFMIMSYDFHKSRSNPGPNFPLRGKEVYGYDMTRMTDDFLRYLPPEKTSIVFGLFGYDWEVDKKGNGSSQGEAKTYQEIKKEFLTDCRYKDCVVRRKNDSAETEIRYTDEGGIDHIVWFEDMQSIQAKERYLKERGIGNFSFWAYSYF